MEGSTPPESSFIADQQFHLVANSVAKLLETARREFERDQGAAKASLATASPGGPEKISRPNSKT